MSNRVWRSNAKNSNLFAKFGNFIKDENGYLFLSKQLVANRRKRVPFFIIEHCKERISNKMAAYLEENIEVIKDCVQKNYTYQQISELLQQNFPDVRRGFSVRNIRLFCSRNEIKKLNDVEVDAIVQHSISEVL